MKKLLLALIAVILMAPAALAADFSHGQTADGCYYFSESKQVVWIKDASGIVDVGHCSSARSTVWYVHRNKMPMPDSYYNQINAMKILLAK